MNSEDAGRPRARAATLMAALAALSTSAACGDGPTGPGAAPEPITELPRALSVVESDLIDGSTRFGLDLLRVLAPGHRSENLFFSPLSASMALGMTLNGAAGTTYDEMAATLGHPDASQEEVNQAYASLLDLLQGLDPTVTVEVANAIWYRPDVSVLTAFQDRVRNAFAAEVDALDFGAPGAVDHINAWVSDNTNGTIDKLYDQLPTGLVMLLANATYFKGDWTEAFDPDETRSGPFAAPGGSVDARFMRQRLTTRHRRLDDVSVVELPYGGGAFVMDLLLPAEGIDPADLVADLDPAGWSARVDELGLGEAVVELPRFELEWERTLNEDLARLGMVDAFQPGAADFTRMIPGGGVWIDEVRQKTFVRVDEVGTEAAAVTGVAVVESLPPTYRFDRPFVVAIRERLSGTLLFVGIVRNPTD